MILCFLLGGELLTILVFLQCDSLCKFTFFIRLLCHLQKQNISKLGDILVIGDTVIPQYIAEIPEL